VEYIRTTDIQTINQMNSDYATTKADGYTVSWREPIFRNGYYYLLLDEVSQPYFEGAEIVAEIPPEHEWHFDLEIQVIFSYEENLRLLSEVPELALYVRNNDIPTVIENGHVYIYVNYLLPEHEAMMKNYGTINPKTE